MPRVADQYAVPVGTDGITDTTIESTKYNSFVHDVELDLNTARPIVAGGTGANNAADARKNIGAEVATQVVTNYDSHVWEAGSFKSGAGATNAPVAGHDFTGIAHVYDATSCFIEARDYVDPSRHYVRKKQGGIWQSWIMQGDDKVDVAGDTMTGNLSITKANPVLALDRTGTGQNTVLVGAVNGLSRWQVNLGSADAEGAEGVGSNFQINRCNNAGTYIGTSLTITRLTGTVSVENSLIAPGGVYWGNGATKGGAVADATNTSIRCPVDAGAIFFQSMTPSAVWTTINASGLNSSGRITANNDLMTSRTGGTAGAVYFGTSANNFLFYDSANYALQGGGLVLSTPGAKITTPKLDVTTTDGLVIAVPGGSLARVIHDVAGARRWSNGVAADGNFYISDESAPRQCYKIHASNGTHEHFGPYFNTYGRIMAQSSGVPTVSVYCNGHPAFGIGTDTTSLFRFHQVDGEGTPNNQLGLFNTSAVFQTFNAVAYKPGGGAWTDSSDARIKNILGDYASGLAAINALRPVRYTFKGNDTLKDTPPENRKELDENNIIIEADSKDAVTVPYGNSNHYHDAVAAKEFIGLIAQEAETVMPEIVTKREGMIDGQPVTDLRDIDSTPLIFALINAVKELSARLEVLEGAGAARGR